MVNFRKINITRSFEPDYERKMFIYTTEGMRSIVYFDSFDDGKVKLEGDKKYAVSVFILYSYMKTGKTPLLRLVEK